MFGKYKLIEPEIVLRQEYNTNTSLQTIIVHCLILRRMQLLVPTHNCHVPEGYETKQAGSTTCRYPNKGQDNHKKTLLRWLTFC